MSFGACVRAGTRGVRYLTNCDSSASCVHQRSSSSRGEALTTPSFLRPPDKSSSSSAGPERSGAETRGGVGERVRTPEPNQARPPSVATCRGEGGDVAHATGGFLCSCSLQPVFLDIIAAHVSLTAADWLDVRDQHKVTVVKLDVTAKHFRWRRRVYKCII